MEIFERRHDLSGFLPPWLSIVMVGSLSFGSLMLISSLLAVPVLIWVTGASMESLPSLLENPSSSPELRIPLLLVNGVASLLAYFVIPWLAVKAFDKSDPRRWYEGQPMPWWEPVLVCVLVFCFMFLNSWFVFVNEHARFPEFLKGFEEWARQMEDRLQDTVQFLTEGKSWTEYLVAMLMVAVVPAIGEEFLFRGFLQNRLWRMLKNPHLAIVIASLVFSAVHMQFYGFIPRFALGLLFGYLFYWSGRLWVPMVAHFFHNGFTLTMIFLYQNGWIETNIDTEEPAPWTTIILFTIIGLVLLWAYRKYQQSISTVDEQVDQSV